ncbi:MAG TPA: hypothetical protein VG871_06660 [Vicinamibacterales bacterium]|nr:hypothetical protein [Vicinamibacterales bacterium]
MIDVQPARVRLYKMATGLPRDVVHRNGHSAVLERDAARQIDLDGLVNLPAAERRAGPAADQQNLVDVVVQNPAESFEMVSAETDRHCFGDPVADRVRMAEALALDDFDFLRSGREPFTRADDEVQAILRGDSRDAGSHIALTLYDSRLYIRG